MDNKNTSSWKVYKLCLKGFLLVTIMMILYVSCLGFKASREKIKPVFSEQSKKVLPSGETIGIYVNTKGILVIDSGQVIDLNGRIHTPAKNKLLPGDYILKLNDKKMKSKKELVKAITKGTGDPLTFTIRRKNKIMDVTISPIETNIKEYKVGIWVKDDLQGLGTITYLDGNHYAALGHSIADSDTGELLDVSGGSIYKADVFGIDKGEKGSPGEIEGMITYETENEIGKIKNNKIYGIEGLVEKGYETRLKESDEEEEYKEVGTIRDVKLGPAYIQSYISGEKETYEIEITGFHKNINGDMEMEIKVVDEDLIDLTGGIIQGMSGSPILQEDKLVGAVTHVFVEDPTRGYGIFVEEMFEDN